MGRVQHKRTAKAKSKAKSSAKPADPPVLPAGPKVDAAIQADPPKDDPAAKIAVGVPSDPSSSAVLTPSGVPGPAGIHPKDPHALQHRVSSVTGTYLKFLLLLPLPGPGALPDCGGPWPVASSPPLGKTPSV
eukprot:GHVU01155117.1.p2 GENE.GHVU01155117.1~~GHVU01155117.1.p2  ORF type:complete len:132 (-),score=7.23 GHVU01155117.1:343-738(-)